ncbi:hypothetical protein FHS42_005450 [Streptomyces zagrosensis]|uniref:Uncharacterized protein n=1 Tax=Streptomyces zagrosensis TaxID=1042984 RepID=A0A7W9QDY3_9ACTN|nr:hypothetical protein [Streptomyces zagrosensis]
MAMTPAHPRAVPARRTAPCRNTATGRATATGRTQLPGRPQHRLTATIATPTTAPVAAPVQLTRHPADASGQFAQRSRVAFPVPAVGTTVQMGIDCRPGYAGRQSLAVNPGGEGGTSIGTVHPAMVPAAGAGPRTAPCGARSRSNRSSRDLGCDTMERGGARA